MNSEEIYQFVWKLSAVLGFLGLCTFCLFLGTWLIKTFPIIKRTLNRGFAFILFNFLSILIVACILFFWPFSDKANYVLSYTFFCLYLGVFIGRKELKDQI